MRIYFPLLLFITIFFISCSTDKAEIVEKNSDDLQLGEISFEVTGAKEALPFFTNGLLLLHSFEYEDAREEFLKAQEKDSTFAMAYWGEAMTYNHSLWQRQEKDKALEALLKLAPTKEERSTLLKTAIEKDFFHAIEILYGEGTKYDRDLAYKNFLESLTKKYPNNHEVAAFYAVSLLGSSRNGRDEVLYNKSAQIAQGILRENPKHPGALHYLIHSYDDPGHAKLAKNAADKYAKVAPDAAHALHMPSHIYVALGNWNAVVNSNIASWNAGVKRMERKGLDNDARSYHALNWLQYGLLQRGEIEKATRLLNDMVKYANEKPTKSARSYLVAMKGAHLVETNSWDSEFAKIAIEVDDLTITKRAGLIFLEGMKAVQKNDIPALSQAIELMKKKRQVAETLVGEKGFAMCSSAGFSSKPPSQLDIDMVKILEMELMAHRATFNNDMEKAESIFKDAVNLDESLSYSYGPPTVLKPVHEAYGEWLLKNGKVEEAISVFEKSLERHPRRLLSLQGLKKAAEKINNTEIIQLAAQELKISLDQQQRSEIL